MPQRFEDLTGQRFGRLVAIRKFEVPSKTTRWVCRCDCGNTTKSYKPALKSGASQSCGCLRKELSSKRGKGQKRHVTHGMGHTPEYGVWCAMRRRCDNPNVERYPSYGGRGIRVCERWGKFENFIADMGRRPSSGYSIERRDNDGDYEPSNCYWATAKEQANNKSTTSCVQYKGKQLTFAEAALVAGMPKGTLIARIYRGWSIDKAIETPLRRL